MTILVTALPQLTSFIIINDAIGSPNSKYRELNCFNIAIAYLHSGGDCNHQIDTSLPSWQLLVSNCLIIPIVCGDKLLNVFNFSIMSI